MFTQERFERWLRGLDPQLPNPFLVQPRIEGLTENLEAVKTASALIAADGVSSINDLTSVDFELPPDGLYVLGVETITATAGSHVVFSAQLLVHN